MTADVSLIHPATRSQTTPPAGAWSKDELEQILAHATPIVRRFLKGLADKGSATADEIGVPKVASAIGYRYARARQKEPLYSSERDVTTGKSVFKIDPKYRQEILDFLAAFQEPAAPPGRRPGRARRADGPAGRSPASPARADVRRRAGPRRAEAAATIPASEGREQRPGGRRARRDLGLLDAVRPIRQRRPEGRQDAARHDGRQGRPRRGGGLIPPTASP
jgi:hypothetical protein